ncbi:MAG: hypothetical protein LUF32_00925, partial [Clostridiales bacterium]|nr:hypothetical protein [Clostridiales bacterium]
EPSAALTPQVELNNDLTKYLEVDFSMKIVLDLMEEELDTSDSDQTIRVMFTGLAETEKSEIQTRLEEITYVDSVDYEADSEDYNVDNYTLYIINTVYDYGSAEESAIEDALDTEFADYDMIWINDDSSSSSLPMWVIALALAILVVILFVMSRSWIEPFFMIAAIVIAIIINMGTNVILGTVSNTTFSIGAILQLILSMDYSIIPMNRYRQ